MMSKIKKNCTESIGNTSPNNLDSSPKQEVDGLKSIPREWLTA
ncbi:MAG: hypothetical protein ACTSRU_16675 [Candidatus Hodarchaeales archaeon]